MHRTPALVLGLGVNGYGIVRSLRREGVPVFGVYEEPDEFGRYSRHCESFALDAPAGDPACRANALVELCRRFPDRPVLFPTSDRFAVLLAEHRDRLAPWSAYHWMPAERLAASIDKGRIWRLCEEAGVMAPRTFVPLRETDLSEAASNFPSPCLVKPANSFDGQLPGNQKNLVAHSAGELCEFYRKHPTMVGRTVWQEIIEGGDQDVLECAVLLSHSGAVAGVATMRKIRQYVPLYGITSFGRTEGNAEIVAATLRLARHLGWVGIASLEFKYGRRDGLCYFIELNPRLPWYNMLFADAAVNFPYLAYLDLTSSIEPLWPEARQRNGVHWVSLELDAGSYWRKRGSGEINVISWLSSLRRARSFAWLEWRDPEPFLRAVWNLARYLGARLLMGRAPSAEPNGQGQPVLSKMHRQTP